MTTLLLPPYVAIRTALVVGTYRLREHERGEGVISAAIAVLVMAFLGAAMWAAFRGLFQDTADKTGDQVDRIGQ